MNATAPSGAQIRHLLHRRVLASNRHRIALGRRLGLRANELAALSLLAEHGMLTPSELGELLVLTSGGVTALVKRLERLGHVRRTRHPQDGRSSVLRASPEAIAAIGELSEPLVSALDEAIGALPTAERRSVIRFLTEVNAATEHAADQLLADSGGQAPDESRDGAEVAPGLWT